MTLSTLQSRHPELFERVSPHGLATIRADGMTGDITEFEGFAQRAPHYSIELHGVSPDQLAAILSALDATRAEARLLEHSREPARNADAE